jgi:hypothetical protein
MPITVKAKIQLARKHMAKSEAARECLAEAVWLYDQGLLALADGVAGMSLYYSVGEKHPDYKRATK